MSLVITGAIAGEVEDPGEAMAVFGRAVKSGKGDAVLEWFDLYLPRCMALVPRRRRDSFLSGVRRAVEDEGIPS